MSTRDLPAALAPAQFEWGIQKAGTQFSGPFNGSPQGVEFVAERWVCSVTLPPALRANAGAIEGFLNWLAGGVNRVRMPHLASGVNRDLFAPRGTLRGAITLGAAASRGNSMLTLAGCAPGATLLTGDMIGCNQLFQAADDAVANGSGVMVVPLVSRVRAATASGSVVVWNKPTTEFIMPAMSARHAHVPAILLGGQFDLIEVY